MMKQRERFGSFVVKQASHIEEIHVTVLHILHEPSGAEIIHIVCDDEENVFALSQKTLPEDDSGAAHILEHTVLCGSKHYPVSDPFFSMLRRSANTFMNAFTAKTWTCYPAASAIKQDFFNLLSVYLDAVFFPNLTRESFEQEGHHYEFEKSDDPSSPLTIKGIVYNEMKGVYSSPTSRLYRKLTAGICPDHPYGYDSGGLPEAILSLTHESLIDFHKKYYHPSRCLYYFYGNIDTKEILTFLEEKLLKDVKKVDPLPLIPLVKRFHKKKREEDYYPCSETDTDKKSFVGFSWLMMAIEHADDLMALMLLDSILMDTDASLLKKKLLSSGLCTSASASYDPDVREIPFLLTCMGTDAKDADKIEELIFTSLREIADEKIPKELIESSLYQLEISRSEKSGECGHPYGLDLYFRAALSYQQGGSLIDHLCIHSTFETLKKQTSNPKYLSNIIEKYFLENKHMYRLSLIPDSTLAEKENAAEKETLEKIKQSLTKQAIDRILSNTKNLHAHHEKKKEESVDCLPMLKLEDLPKEIHYFPLHKDLQKELSIYYHDNFTNDIIYADLVFDIPQIKEEDLLYLQLFSHLMTDLGAGGRNYLENLELIHKTLGFIHAHISLNIQCSSTNNCMPTFTLSSKALMKETKEMTKIMTDFLLNLDYKDDKRIRELIIRYYTALMTRFNSSAIGYAIKQSSSSFSPWAHMNNLWNGRPFFEFMKDLAENIEDRISIVMEKFASFSKTLFHLNHPQIVLSCNQMNYEQLKKASFYDFAKFDSASSSFRPWIEFPTPIDAKNEAFTTSSGVANNAFAISTVTMQSSYSPAIKLASYLMENLYIHPIIREQQGAYTCRVSYNSVTGIFQMLSSRDPKIASSYQAFEIAIQAIAEGKFNERNLHEAKLCYTQDVDHPTPPSIKASVTYFQHKIGLTPEMRQEFRDAILSMQKEEIQKAVQICLLEKLSTATKVTYAPDPLLKEFNF